MRDGAREVYRDFRLSASKRNCRMTRSELNTRLLLIQGQGNIPQRPTGGVAAPATKGELRQQLRDEIARAHREKQREL